MQQIALIKDWAKAGAPEGDPSLKPKPPKFTDGWQGGQPDQVLTIPAKYSLSADGPDQYRCFVVPMGLDHDVYVDGIEFRPENRRIVHHALVFLDASGQAKKMAAASPDGSYPCFGGPGFPAAGMIGGWAPGITPPPRNPALSQPIRAGMDVVIQIHYHPSGKPEAGSILARALHTPARRPKAVHRSCCSIITSTWRPATQATSQKHPSRCLEMYNWPRSLRTRITCVKT